jgi:hypothetical protein
MYKACRHIKPNGLRCESRVLRGGNFCYFHSKLHNPPAGSEPEPFKLPIPEDLASIPMSVARISEALIARRIDVRQSAQLFWGLKLAYQAILSRDQVLPYSVMNVTKTEQGDELAPELTLCVREDECRTCKMIHTCTNSLYYDGYDVDNETKLVDDPQQENGDEEDEDEGAEDAGEGDEESEQSGDTDDAGADSNEDSDDDADEDAAEAGDTDDADANEDDEDDDVEAGDIESDKEFIAARAYLDSIRRAAGLDP